MNNPVEGEYQYAWKSVSLPICSLKIQIGLAWDWTQERKKEKLKVIYVTCATKQCKSLQVISVFKLKIYIIRQNVGLEMKIVSHMDSAS
jgi:hypothetical protein